MAWSENVGSFTILPLTIGLLALFFPWLLCYFQFSSQLEEGYFKNFSIEYKWNKKDSLSLEKKKKTQTQTWGYLLISKPPNSASHRYLHAALLSCLFTTSPFASLSCLGHGLILMKFWWVYNVGLDLILDAG